MMIESTELQAFVRDSAGLVRGAVHEQELQTRGASMRVPHASTSASVFGARNRGRKL